MTQKRSSAARASLGFLVLCTCFGSLGCSDDEPVKVDPQGRLPAEAVVTVASSRRSYDEGQPAKLTVSVQRLTKGLPISATVHLAVLERSSRRSVWQTEIDVQVPEQGARTFDQRVDGLARGVFVLTATLSVSGHEAAVSEDFPFGVRLPGSSLPDTVLDYRISPTSLEELTLAVQSASARGESLDLDLGGERVRIEGLEVTAFLSDQSESERFYRGSFDGPGMAGFAFVDGHLGAYLLRPDGSGFRLELVDGRVVSWRTSDALVEPVRDTLAVTSVVGASGGGLRPANEGLGWSSGALSPASHVLPVFLYADSDSIPTSRIADLFLVDALFQAQLGLQLAPRRSSSGTYQRMTVPAEATGSKWLSGEVTDPEPSLDEVCAQGAWDVDQGPDKALHCFVCQPEVRSALRLYPKARAILFSNSLATTHYVELDGHASRIPGRSVWIREHGQSSDFFVHLLAHELGHTLGALHDCTKSDDGKYTLMYAPQTCCTDWWCGLFSSKATNTFSATSLSAIEPTVAALPSSACIDLDVDGYFDAQTSIGECEQKWDCDDARSSVFPGAAETCNGRDDDCNGVVDDVARASCSTACETAWRLCIQGAWVCQARPQEVEVCDGIDNDCNHSIDEGCTCVVGSVEPCYSGPAGTQAVGPCRAGTRTCAPTGWGLCTGQVLPTPEICNGADDDCRGGPDDGGVCASPVVEAPLSGVVPGVFSYAGGAFEISVSPLDANGQLISSGVSASNFAFNPLSVARTPAPGVPVTGGSATVTGIEIIQPTAGMPTRTVICIDSSGSMGSNDPARLRVQAARDLIARLGSQDEAAVLDFGNGATSGLMASRLLQGFTSDHNLLNAAVDRVLASGGTPMYESLLDAIGLLQSSGTERQIVLLTDGLANSSSHSPTTVAASASSAGISIFTVGLGSGVDSAVLTQLASATGGSYAQASDAFGLSRLFDGIGAAVSQGRVVVHGQGLFAPPLPSTGAYQVSGGLVTSLGLAQVTTPFSFAVDVR